MDNTTGPEGARPEDEGKKLDPNDASPAQDSGAPHAHKPSPDTVAGGEVEYLMAELDKTRAEADEHKDRSIRLLAEMENLRRRTEREKTDTAKYAISRFARDVLEVADNFQRAIDTVPGEVARIDPALKSFLEGVQLTERQLLAVLERHGVKRIDPVGQKFDPNIHQAMMEMDNAEVPAGTVLQAYQPAYMIDERVLRPAMVVVSKGGPKVAKAAESGPANDDHPFGGATDSSQTTGSAAEPGAGPTDTTGSQ